MKMYPPLLQLSPLCPKPLPPDDQGHMQTLHTVTLIVSALSVYQTTKPELAR